MWTSTLELTPRRVLLTQVAGRFWPAAYFSSFAPLQVQNLPRQPLPAPNWVRVRNRLAGICGCDLRLIYVDSDFRTAPAALPNHTFSYPGHEVVGEVIEVGDDVQYLHVGDRVVLQSGPNCISTGAQPLCRSCASGNYNLCERASSLPGPQPVGGGWSEEMLLHEQQLFRISPEMSDEQAVLLEPSAVALHAVLRRPPQPGEQVLVIGAGAIGLLTLQVLRALAPQTTVSVMARHAFQIEQATRMGAAHILYPQDSYQAVARTTGAQLYTGTLGNKMLLGGYDVVFDTVGSKQTLRDSLRWTRAGGTVVAAGLSLHTMRIDLTPIWYQEVNLIGTYGHSMETWPIGTYERRPTFAIAAEMIERAQLYPEKLITQRFALNNYREALATAKRKSRTRAIKVVFDYALLPASVVPNVRAAARQRRSITTTATWPREEQTYHEEPSRLTTPDEQFIPPAPEPEPIMMPTRDEHFTAPASEPEPIIMSIPEEEFFTPPVPESEPIIMSTSEEEFFIPLTPPATQEPEPIETPTPASQSPTVEAETGQPPASPGEEHPTPNDESPATVIPKPGRSRQTAKSRKTTGDVRAPIKSNVTNDASETLQE